jgi:sortase A
VIERSFIALGIVLLVFSGGAKLTGEVQKQLDLKRFEAALAAAGSGGPTTRLDTSLWSPERIKAYEESLREDLGAPLSILAIPKIGLEVPVLAGTDDLTLNRAVGLIEGTVRPGEIGNSGIAGHRDGFFRGLKDVVAGDAVEVRSLSGRRSYVVESIRIVQPEDVWVLEPTSSPVLTLVTCYPFYFIGSAPQRYIVRAVSRDPAVPPESVRTTSQAPPAHVRKEAPPRETSGEVPADSQFVP